MKQLLIIPDVHGRTFWKDAVSQYEDKVEKIIFLGFRFLMWNIHIILIVLHTFIAKIKYT